MTFSNPHMLLLTSMMQLIMTMASHLHDVWSLDVFPVTVVMSVKKAAFCPATNKPVLTQSDPDVRGLHGRCAPTMLQRSQLNLTQATLEPNVFWNDTVPSAGSWQTFGGNYCLHLQGQRVSQARSKHSSLLLPHLPYSSILKMEVLHSSETLVNFYQAMPFNIPDSLAFCTGGGMAQETSPSYKEHDLTNGDESALHQNKLLQSLALPPHTSYLWAGGIQKVTRHRQYDLSSILAAAGIFLFGSITRSVLGPTNLTVKKYQGFFPLQHESNYLALSSDEFNNAWSFTSALTIRYHSFMIRSRKYSRLTSRWFLKNCQLQNKIHFEILTVVFFVALSAMGRNT
jgi:hypothetical protein